MKAFAWSSAAIWEWHLSVLEGYFRVCIWKRLLELFDSEESALCTVALEGWGTLLASSSPSLAPAAVQALLLQDWSPPPFASEGILSHKEWKSLSSSSSQDWHCLSKCKKVDKPKPGRTEKPKKSSFVFFYFMEFYLPHKILICLIRNTSGVDFENERWCPLAIHNIILKLPPFQVQFQCAGADWDLVSSANRDWQWADSQIWLSRNW